ncbi:hypothetical protein AVEN_167771-1 [Araneus ventricosus]|uniref:Uncharacterized protein n=1 Tax=Araneus ventricosus TaxID=182803 RepID=A0A4Y2J841_ARAVE|nr:hypothetical protein AVEN_167771-1 [Araneus ventricosus]
MPEKSFLIHDDIMPSFMKDLHNIHESYQGSFVLDNIFTPRRKVFGTGLREMKAFCHWARLSGHGPFVTYLHRFGLCSHDRCVCGDKYQAVGVYDYTEEEKLVCRLYSV